MSLVAIAFLKSKARHLILQSFLPFFLSSRTQNIRVISLYYTRITISRLAELLDLPVDQAETSLADLVISGTVYAKIDRPAGVVSFAPKTSDSDKLNAWSGDMQKLLDYVETTSHLIHREMAVVRAGLTVKD